MFKRISILFLSLGLPLRLFLISVVAFLPALLLALSAHHGQRRLAREAAESQALALVRRVAAAQALLVERALAQVETLADVPVVRNGTPEACSRYVARLRQRQLKMAVNITRVAADGRVTCSAVALQGDLNLSHRPSFQRLIAARQPLVGDYTFGPIVGHGVVTVTAPLLESPTAAVQGIVNISLDLRWLADVFARSSRPSGTQLTLVDQNGVVLARFPEDPKAAVGTRAPESEAVLAAARQLPGGQDGLLLLPSQPDRIYAAHQISHEGAARLLVYAAVPAAMVEAPAEAQLRQHLLGLLAAFLLMGSGSVLASRYLVVRPIQRLQAAARRLAEGDLAARAALGAGHDEVASLGRSFDRMAESLQAREAALRQRQRRIERLNRAYAVLSGVNRLILRQSSREDLLLDACRLIVECGGYALAWIGLLDPRGQRWSMVQVSGTPPPEVAVPAAGSTAAALPELAEVLAHGRLLVHTASLQEGQPPFTRVLLPLQGEDAPRGCMALYSPPSAVQLPVDESEMRLLEELAADIAHALKHIAQAERLSYVSTTDLLTALPNAASFRDRLAFTLQVLEHEPAEAELAVMLVSLKGLRNINTVHGLHVGDQVLREAAAQLEAILPADAELARLRGGLFGVMLLPRMHTMTLTSVIERILESFGGTKRVGELDLALGVHLGISVWPADGRTAEVLLQHAETALSNAREAPERFRFFTPQLQLQAQAQLALEGPLHQATKRNELYLLYQPVVAVATQRLVGVEALLRWRHPQRGDIPPSEFMPLAESAGLAVGLGEWVMNEAFRQARRWAEGGMGDVKVAVNVAASQLKDPAFLARLDLALSRSEVDAQRMSLAIELTESELMEDAPHAVELLRQLKARGFSLSIDDFGTGYSSLAYLGRFPLDTLKIDIAFVRDLDQSPVGASIVQAIVALAQALGLQTVAEGVETPTQFRHLETLGCFAVQGYLFGAAMPAEAIEGLAGRVLPVGSD